MANERVSQLIQLYAYELAGVDRHQLREVFGRGDLAQIGLNQEVQPLQRDVARGFGIGHQVELHRVGFHPDAGV